MSCCVNAEHQFAVTAVSKFWMLCYFSEEFNSGFGSHTPMILGQAKVVRYFPNFER